MGKGFFRKELTQTGSPFKLKPGQYILRLLTAWFFGAFAAVLVGDYNAFLSPLLEKGSLFALLVIGFVVFVGTCFLKRDKLVFLLLILGTESLCLSITLKIVNTTISVPLSVGLCLVLCAVVAYSDLKDLDLKIKNRTLYIAVAVMLVLMTAYIGAACIVKYNNYNVYGYDHGIFAQMFHNMKETGQMVTTYERNELMSHFKVHFSPIFYLLLPLYMIFPSSQALLIINGFIIISGIVPLMFLCKRFKLSDISTLLFCVCYAIYPTFIGNGLWGLHENAFLAPLILWLFYFSEKDCTLGAVIFAVLLLCVKEDAAMYLAIIALYYIVSGKSLARNFILLALSLLCFGAVTMLMQKYGLGVMSDSRFGNYIGEDGSLFTMIRSVIENPSFTLAQVFTTDKLLFLLQMFMPLCFLPFLGKKPARLILFIPMLLINLMTRYSYGYDIYFQYTLGSAAILFYLSVAAYSEMGEKRKKTLICATLCSTVMACSTYLSPGYLGRTDDVKQRNEEIKQALSVIPDDASVAATDSPSGNLTERDELYYINSANKIYSDVPKDVEYYAIRRGHGWERMEEVIEKLRDTDGLTEIVTTENIVIFKNENARAGK